MRVWLTLFTQLRGNRSHLNLRRAPEALAQMNTPATKKLFAGTGIFSAVELESRFHVRLERYIKDVLIEMQMLTEMLGTQILRASYSYLGELAAGAARAKAAGIKNIPQKAAAESAGALVASPQSKGAALHAAIHKAEGMHADIVKCAAFLTSTGSDAMLAARAVSDKLEVTVGDEYWPLPRYREMLFPV